jgi:hypothetical protein
MGAFIRRHRWLSASLMLVAGSIGWWVSGGIRGQLVAYFDVARGHYEILSLGLPAPWRSEFAPHLAGGGMGLSSGWLQDVWCLRYCSPTPRVTTG